ncbi:butyrophilin subfamily 3 member A2-like [Epinephelus moara]|uniref:butyrophilin subfamily 3 member A2-like n=1 Tax=Epinephelus moara TaxID=300413 RepID=UPI00214E052E|nr:butyrophilin subfamily 3 member A2-like [Epinephelus moara]
MPLMMDGGPSKPRLNAICTMIFHFTAAVLFLTCPCRGQSQMVSPSQPIVAAVGQDIMLPCHLEPAVNVTDMTVEWTRPDLNPRFVYVWRDGVELEMKKHQSYVGRTSVSITKLKHGDISLKLCKVKISDKGKYRCFIPTLSRESTVELVVGAVSSLTVSFMRTDNDLRGVVLQCESAGWYPEPEVLWLDGEGKLLSAGPTETVRGPDDLYTVSSRVTVEKRHSNSFTCRVQQRNINQTRETHIQVPEYLFMAQSNAAHIIICLIVCILSVVAVVFIVRKMGQIEKKTSDGSTELQHLMGGGFREKLMTGRDNAKAKLDEELQKNKGELQHVQQVITTLMDQKEGLENQEEKLNSLLQKDNAEKEENEKDQENIGFMEKEKKKKLEKMKEDVERRMKAYTFFCRHRCLCFMV